MDIDTTIMDVGDNARNTNDMDTYDLIMEIDM